MAKKQLADWGLDYFDMFLMHFPLALKYVDPDEHPTPCWSITNEKGDVIQDKTPLHTTWAAMEELVDEGLVKNIGVSNFAGAVLLDLVRYARIPPAVLQVEHHPYLTQLPLIKLAQGLGIHVTAYSSFGPMGYTEIDNPLSLKTTLLFVHPVISKIAANHHGVTTAQVILRWSTQRGLTVIPKSNDAEKMNENLECCSFDLTEAEINEISALNQNFRFNDPADIDPKMAIFA